MHFVAVQVHLVGKGEDDVRELQSLGLVDGQDAHGGGILGRADVDVLLLPVLEIVAELVAVGLDPALQVVHEGLDIKDLPLEGGRIPCAHRPQQLLAEIHQRVVFRREGQVHRIREEAADPVVGILETAQQRDQAPDHRGGFQQERIVGDHRDAVADQVRGDGGAFLLAAHKYGNIAPLGAPAPHFQDGRQDGLQLVSAETDAHLSLLRVFLHNRLHHVGVDVLQAQLSGRPGEETVVESDHRAGTAPITVQRLHIGSGEGTQHLASKQLPVGIAPAVDALLDITHDEVAARLRLALLQQGQEIVPLDVGRVLEFVQQEMLVAHAQLLIHEGGVGAADDLAQQGVGLVQAEDVLLRREGVELLVELASEAQLVEQAVQQEGRTVVAVGFVEKRSELFRCGEGALAGLLDQFAGDGFDPQRGGAGPELPDQGAALLPDPLQAVLAESLRAGDPQTLRELPEFVVLEVLARLQQALVHLEAPPLVEGVRERGLDPVQQLPAVLGQGVQDTVHGLRDQRLLVQLDLVVGELADLAGEGLEGLLEEAVDGAHAEGAVVVEQVDEHTLRAGVRLRQFREIAKDARLHLGGGLVGEGDRQDMTVRIGLPAAQQQVDIGLGEAVGLARTGAGFQNLHRPQMFLKSHHSQVFRSSVRLKGTEVSASSASSPWKRASIRVWKLPPTATLSTSRTNRRDV